MKTARVSAVTGIHLAHGLAYQDEHELTDIMLSIQADARVESANRKMEQATEDLQRKET